MLKDNQICKFNKIVEGEKVKHFSNYRPNFCFKAGSAEKVCEIRAVVYNGPGEEINDRGRLRKNNGGGEELWESGEELNDGVGEGILKSLSLEMTEPTAICMAEETGQLAGE